MIKGIAIKKGDRIFYLNEYYKKGINMSENITIKEIAQLCGVGISTVSRAMNNHADINPVTKKAIMEVIKENNYVPNNSARNLKRTDAKCIAVLVKGIENPLFNVMIKVMEKEIKKQKYSMVLHHVEFDEDEIDVAIELIKEKRLRGIVFLGGYFRHGKEKLGELKVPFIISTVGDETKEINTYSSVAVDDEKESKKAVDYLISVGHSKIAILSAPDQDESIGKLRLNGYLAALEHNGIPINRNLIRTVKTDQMNYSVTSGYQITKELLASKEEFTALFAISDTLAIGACRAIIEEGKKIPEDYSVIGYDGIEMGRYYNPSITTIAQPIKKMAEVTINLLFDVLRKKSKHQHKIFQANLEVRESSSPYKTNEI